MYHFKSQSTKSARGMSLLEVLLSISLALLLIGGLTSIYINMHKVTINQRVLEYHLKEAQMIMSIFREEIAEAGHIGCAKLAADFIVHPLIGEVLTADNALVVKDDSLIVGYQSYPGALVIQAEKRDIKATFDTGMRFNHDDVLVISDCLKAEIIAVDKTVVKNDQQNLTLKYPLKEVYSQYAEIGKLIRREYRLDNNGSHRALVRLDKHGTKVMIADNVDNLHFIDDGHGVSYQFTTHYQNTMRKWSGYAARS